MTTCSQAAGGGADSANKRTAQTTARRRAAERGSGVPPARGGRRRPWRTALCWWYRRRCHPPAQAATPWTRRAVRPAPHTTAPARGLWESQSPARRRAAQRALAMGPQEAAGCAAPACSPAAPSSSRTSGTAAGREKREGLAGDVGVDGRAAAADADKKRRRADKGEGSGGAKCMAGGPRGSFNWAIEREREAETESGHNKGHGGWWAGLWCLWLATAGSTVGSVCSVAFGTREWNGAAQSPTGRGQGVGCRRSAAHSCSAREQRLRRVHRAPPTGAKLHCQHLFPHKNLLCLGECARSRAAGGARGAAALRAVGRRCRRRTCTRVQPRTHAHALRRQRRQCINAPPCGGAAWQRVGWRRGCAQAAARPRTGDWHCCALVHARIIPPRAGERPQHTPAHRPYNGAWLTLLE